MSEQRDILERLERHAKFAMPAYPDDLCSDAKREIASLRSDRALQADKIHDMAQELEFMHERLASARKALERLLECEAKFITRVRDEDMPAFNDLKEARFAAKAVLTDEYRGEG